MFIQWNTSSNAKQQATATCNMNEYHKYNVEW